MDKNDFRATGLALSIMSALPDNAASSAAAAAASAAEAKAVQESIPQDYTALSNDVDDLKSAVKANTENNGGRFIACDGFVPGCLGNSAATYGTLNPSIMQYRVASDTIFTAKRNMSIIADTDYRFNIFYFVSGSFTEQTGRISAIELPVGTTFKIEISKATEDTSSTANVSEYLNAITYDSRVYDLAYNRVASEDVLTVDDGKYHFGLYVPFIHGAWNYSNGVASLLTGKARNNQIATTEKLLFEQDTEVTIEKGFIGRFYLFNGDTFFKDSQNQGSDTNDVKYIIPSGYSVYCNIRRYTNISSEYADIKDFATKVTFKSVMIKRFDELSNNVKIIEADVNQLYHASYGDNVLNPDAMMIGYRINNNTIEKNANYALSAPIELKRYYKYMMISYNGTSKAASNVFSVNAQGEPDGIWNGGAHEGYNIQDVDSSVSYVRIMYNTKDTWTNGFDKAKVEFRNAASCTPWTAYYNKAPNAVGYQKHIEELIHSAMRPVNASSDAYLSATQPLMLMQIGDMHGNGNALDRYATVWKDIINKCDDMVFMGDMVFNTRTNNSEYFTGHDLGKDILVTIGNHDVYDSGDGGYVINATQAEMYAQYMEDNIDGWSVEYTEDKTYYYKDYTDKKIRLIVLNIMLSGQDASDQLEWLTSTLASAKTAVTGGLSVVISMHFPPYHAIKKPSKFTSIDFNITDTCSQDICSAVDAFRDGGGKFICYLCGHTHNDCICYPEGFTDQLGIVVDASGVEAGNQWSDTMRTVGDQSEDLFNLVCIDTTSTIVKVIRVGADRDRYLRHKGTITINYLTNEILSED
jgi:hypothetical protein